MNENELLKMLEKLETQVTTEFEVLHEYLYQKERSILGLIAGIGSEVFRRRDEMLDEMGAEMYARETNSKQSTKEEVR